jgi:hypothetical protein
MVFMMHDFGPFEKSSNMSFHHKPMFHDGAAAWVGMRMVRTIYSDVTIPVTPPSTFPLRTIGTGKLGDVPAFEWMNPFLGWLRRFRAPVGDKL